MASLLRAAGIGEEEGEGVEMLDEVMELGEEGEVVVEEVEEEEEGIATDKQNEEG